MGNSGHTHLLVCDVVIVVGARATVVAGTPLTSRMASTLTLYSVCGSPPSNIKLVCDAGTVSFLTSTGDVCLFRLPAICSISTLYPSMNSGFWTATGRAHEKVNPDPPVGMNGCIGVGLTGMSVNHILKCTATYITPVHLPTGTSTRVEDVVLRVLFIITSE